MGSKCLGVYRELEYFDSKSKTFSTETPAIMLKFYWFKCQYDIISLQMIYMNTEYEKSLLYRSFWYLDQWNFSNTVVVSTETVSPLLSNFWSHLSIPIGLLPIVW